MILDIWEILQEQISEIVLTEYMCATFRWERIVVQLSCKDSWNRLLLYKKNAHPNHYGDSHAQKRKKIKKYVHLYRLIIFIKTLLCYTANL